MIKIALTNLGKYNEGELVFEWLELPATKEEFEECKERIGINEEYEEYFISDYEVDFDYEISEYSNIDDLNELAESMENYSEEEVEVFKACMELGLGVEEATKIISDCDYVVWAGCETMAEVAEQYLEETGALNGVPSHLVNYIDFEAYGRDMEFEGSFVETDNGYVEILR